MSARQEMAELLEHWRKLTLAEAGAIQSAAWPALREIQAAKAILQKRVAQVGEKTPAGPGRHPFHTELLRLISLETRNSELLAAQLRRAGTERETLNEAARKLRQVHRSYASKPEGVWNCYS
jgi:hypothetical protein